jgi:hypothetical protein
MERDRKTDCNLTQWIKAYQRELDRHIHTEMLELEKLLKDYLEAMLNLCHRRLLRGTISLSQYYKDTMMLAECGQRLNRIDEDSDL